MSEYPDHLNPFKESDKKKFGKTLTRSFRELKGFLRQSFKKKKTKSSQDADSEDIVIRKAHDAYSYNTLRNNVMSLPSPPTYSAFTSPPLPRSRFKERLSRSSLNDATFYDERCNPFAEEGLNPFDDPPVPYRRRRSKKIAPTAPSSSNPDVNFIYKTRGSSKWSLTSSETDYTIDDKSEYSGDVTYSHSLRECLDNFNKEMDTLNKGSLEMGGSTPNILGGTRTKILEETEYTTKSADVLRATHSREINNNVSEEMNGYKHESDSEEVESRILVSGKSPEDETRSISTQHESEEQKLDDIHEEGTDHQAENHPGQNVEEKDEEQAEIEEQETDREEVIVYSETKNIDDQEKSCLNKVKIYIDQENGASDPDETENSEDSKETSPIPKLRKIKLEKDVLLGDASQ